MSTTALTTHPRRRAIAHDWYAVDLPPQRPPDRHDTFATVAVALSGPIDETNRRLHDGVVGDLARAAGRPDLSPAASDPDPARHRLAAHVLARFVRRPDHPALLAARRRLAPKA